MNKISFVIILLAILLCSIGLRLAHLNYIGFYEPDGFYHYSIANQVISNNGIFPALSSLDNHTINEPTWLYQISTEPYSIFDGKIPLNDIMRYMPVIFWILTFIGVYAFSKEVFNNKKFILLTLFILAFSFANLTRTMAMNYRGDSFISVPLIFGLIFLAKGLKHNESKLTILAYLLISGILLGLCNYLWNGALFVVAILFITFIIMFWYGILTYDIDIFKRAILLVIPVLLFCAFFILGVISGIINPSQEIFSAGQTSLNAGGITLTIASVMLVLWISQGAIFNFLFKRGNETFLIGSVVCNVILLGLIAELGINILIPTTGSFLQGITSQLSGQTTGIQELATPNPIYLLSGFGTQLYMTPMLLILFIGSAFTTNLLVVFLISLIPLLVVYTMYKYKNGQAYKEENKKPAFIILLAYFIVTGFLTIVAIRFESLFSIPVAMLSAYTIMGIFYKLKNANLLIKYLAYMVIAMLLVFLALYSGAEVATATQADYMNQQFITALNWISTNTPQNSTFLAEWTDGSIIEGYANRFSFTDSVSYGNDVLPFDKLLLNSSQINSTTFIPYSKPNYLLIRNITIFESIGIAKEAGLNASKYNTKNLSTLMKSFDNTNLMKLMRGCSRCSGLNLAFENNDTKIYHINYP